MSSERLQHLLEELHHELETGPPLDTATRTGLLTLAADLQHAATGSGAADAPDRAGDRLRAHLEQFEASHPALARVLANLIDTLALYGI